MCETADMRLGDIHYDPKKTSNYLDLMVVSPPSHLTLEEPCWVKFMLINWSKAPMLLQLKVDHNTLSTGIEVHGISKYNLGNINPNYSIEFNVLLFPKAVGIHKFEGLLALD